MCIFSRPVEIVSDTNIFARTRNGRQVLVYGMTYAAASDLAMVLPLPVILGMPEDAVSFINMERYPDFFDDLKSGFPPRMLLTLSVGSRSVSLDEPKLKVHDVGSYEASLVPRLEDFGRLDERFRLSSGVWDLLTEHRDSAFAVFKLKSTAQGLKGTLRGALGMGARPRGVHPMALAFPSRTPAQLYFPTVHVHDDQVHATADFKHMLYCQPEQGMIAHLEDWERSTGAASEFMKIPQAEGILDPAAHCYRLPLEGRYQNHDASVGENGSTPDMAGMDSFLAAEAALSQGGTLGVLVDGRHQRIHSQAEIPRRSFRISELDLTGHANTTRGFCDSFFQGSQFRRAWAGLETLRLSRSAVSDWGINELQRLKSLRCLWLDQTQITDHAVKFVVKLDLTELHLEGTPLSEVAVETIRRERPRCRVFR